MTLQQLPCFSDLFFLPRIFDPKAETYLNKEDSTICVVLSQDQKADHYEDFLKELPNVSYIRKSLSFEIFSKRAHSQNVLLTWPDGQMQGVVLYDTGHYSLSGNGSAVNNMSSGQSMRVVKLKLDEPLLDGIKGYLEEELIL